MVEDEHSGPRINAGFRKKAFTPRTFLLGTFRLARTLPALMRAKRADRVSDQLTEKIVLAVTAVNDCRYCARLHVRVARGVGVDEDVIADILEHDIGTAVDADERPALLFAQRYAETDERPGEVAVSTLVDRYGPEMAADVLAFSRAIYWTNLLGNTFDAIRFRIARTVDGRKNEQRPTESDRTTVWERYRSWCPL